MTALAGQKQVYIDDLEVGSTGPEKRHTLTRTDLVAYAGASGDYNPMHHDEIKAQAAGLPSVFGHGMFSAGFLAGGIVDFVGAGNLRRYAVRFTKQTWPGDVLVTKVTVKAKREESGEQLVDLDCELVTEAGVTVVSGEATAVLPKREG